MSYTSPIVSKIVDESVDCIFDQQAGSDLLGWEPPDSGLMRASRDYARRYTGPVYPRSEWEDRIRQMDEANGWRYRRIGHRFRQREGSCVYNALSTCCQVIWNVQFGDDEMIPFSPNSGYKLNSRGPNSGSYVGGAIKHSESVGLLPSQDYQPNLERVRAGDFAHVFGETGNYYESLPSGWKDTARLFRAHEWEWCSTVEEWVSALLSGYVAEGGRDSHAICHCGLAIDGGRLYSVYCNSWGDWGTTLETYRGPLRSFGFDTESKIRTMVARDAFVLRTMRRPTFMRAAV